MSKRDLEPYQEIARIMFRDMALGYIDDFDAKHAKQVLRAAREMQDEAEKYEPGSRTRATAEEMLGPSISRMMEGSVQLSKKLRIRFAEMVGLDTSLLPPFEQPVSERPQRFFRIFNIPKPKEYNKGEPKWEPF